MIRIIDNEHEIRKTCDYCPIIDILWIMKSGEHIVLKYNKNYFMTLL